MRASIAGFPRGLLVAIDIPVTPLGVTYVLSKWPRGASN